MEIKFNRTYTPSRGKRYVMGEIPAMLGFAMEIADPRVRMKEGKLNPGEICMLLFALTPEEYILKDSDPKALDALADKLLKQVPADRLLGWRIVDLKGAAVQRAVQPQAGGSIDDGAFIRRVREAAAKRMPAGPIDAHLLEARRLQLACTAKDAPESSKQQWLAARQALGMALQGLSKIWVAYDLATGDRWPAVGFDGRLEIFTTAERAQRAVQQIHASQGNVATLSLREIPGNEIGKLLQGCAADGLFALRVDNGFAAAELTLKDFREDAPEANAMLRSMMVREIQYGMRLNRYKAENAPEKNVQGAMESMLTLRNFVWREAGNTALYALCVGGRRENCVMLTPQAGKEHMLAVFTNQARAQAFAEKMKGNPAKPVQMPFDEIAQCAAACDGLLVDVGYIGYRLLKADFDKVRDLRSKPPMVVRLQQPQPIVKKDDAAGSLPDPDKFDVQAKPRAVEEKQAEPASETEEKKGFLKKLFGKR